MSEIYTAAKKITLPPAVTNLTSVVRFVKGYPCLLIFDVAKMS